MFGWLQENGTEVTFFYTASDFSHASPILALAFLTGSYHLQSSKEAFFW